MNQEFRRAKRKQADERIDIVDEMLESTVGLIGNISETGLMMLANRPMRDDALFQFQFTLADQGGHQRALSVGAHQLWSEAANNPGQHWVGFCFIDISAADLAVLRVWIDLPGSQYV